MYFIKHFPFFLLYFGYLYGQNPCWDLVQTWQSDRLLNPGFVQNQQGAHTCWICSFASYLEQRHFLEAGQHQRLSIHWMDITSLRNQTLGLLSGGKETLEIAQFNKELDKGNLSMALVVLNQVGIIPHNSWQPKSSIHNTNVRSRLYQDLYKVLSNHLKILAPQMRPNRKQSLLEKAVHDLDEVIENYVGQLPYNHIKQINQESSPKGWQQNIVALKKVVDYRLKLNDSADKPTTSFWVTHYPYFNSQGQPIWFYFPMLTKSTNPNDFFKEIAGNVDKKQGVILTLPWDFSAFDSPRSSLERKEIFHPIEPSHSIFIVDYEKDQQGIITSLIGQNSWGSAFGKQGLVRISRDYILFHRAVISAMKLLPKEELAMASLQQIESLLATTKSRL